MRKWCSIQDARIESALPQAAPAVQAAVEILGVLPGHVLHQSADAAFLPARHHQVNVIRHQRMAMHQDAAVIGVVGEKFEKLVPVFVREKDRLSIIATLRDM